MKYETWLVRESPTRFAVFRVLLGVVLLADLAHVHAHRALLASEWTGFIPLGPALVVWMLAVFAFTAGVWTRTAALASYLCAVVLLGHPSAVSQIAGDSIAISLSLLALFLPCGAALSVDRWMDRREQPVWALAGQRWALAGFLSLVYVDSALRKLCSPMWRAGLGAVAPASLPNQVWIDTSWLEALPAPLLRAVGLGVIAFELFFPLLYAGCWTRTPAVLVGISLHLGIAVVYPIPAFSGLMLAIYLGLLPERWYTPLERFDSWVARWFRAPALLGSPAPQPHDQSLRRSWQLAQLAAVIWVALTVVTFVADLMPNPEVWRVWGRLRWVVFRTTGILSHGVFDDCMFHDYRYQVRLVPEQSTGGTLAMPYARNGLFAWSVRDRVWEHWWKRTQAPWVSIADAERRLADWTAFYWPVASESMDVRIEARPQQVALDHVDAALFRKNQSVAWRQIGRVRLARDRAPELTWVQPPDPAEEWIGEFLLRVLSQDPPHRQTSAESRFRPCDKPS